MAMIRRFVECLLPITACNLHCSYCYVIQRNNRKMKQAQLKYTPEQIGQAMLLDRWGVTYFSICGAGETTLQNEIADITYNILKNGHYVNITTNGTIRKSLEEIIEKAGKCTMNVIDVTMMQLFLPSKLRTKKVHISFDDVHDSFKSAIDNDCQSIFEIPFFNSLRKLNSKYGAKFSLYVFDDPSVVYPENVLDELRGCSSWISVGYHSGIDGFANVKSVERFLNIFENTGCISGRTRLHGFSADKTVIQRLKSAGIREFFCSDDTRDSYGISDSDFSSGGVSPEKECFLQKLISGWSIVAFCVYPILQRRIGLSFSLMRSHMCCLRKVRS